MSAHPHTHTNTHAHLFARTQSCTHGGKLQWRPHARMRKRPLKGVRTLVRSGRAARMPWLSTQFLARFFSSLEHFQYPRARAQGAARRSMSPGALHTQVLEPMPCLDACTCQRRAPRNLNMQGRTAAENTHRDSCTLSGAVLPPAQSSFAARVERPEFGRAESKFAQHRSELGRDRSRIGRNWANPGQIWPKPALKLVEFGVEPSLGQIWSNSAKCWPTTSQTWPTSDLIWSTSVQSWPNVSHVLADVG